MIIIEYDKKTGTVTKHLKGDSTLLLFELNALVDELLEAFYAHGQENLVLDELLDVVSDFAEAHIPKTKGDERK